MEKIIDGKKISSQILDEIKIEVEKLKNHSIYPKLVVILVGDNPASKVYVRNKERACKKVGIISEIIHLEESVTEKEVLNKINELNNDDTVHGILLQLPLPEHIDSNEMLLKINPEKDVDGFNPINLGKLMIGLEAFEPCTPLGIVELLKRKNVETVGKNVVILGRSNIVGKPLANMFLKKGLDSTVTVCHSKTNNIQEITNKADILVAAIGKPEFVTKEFIKEGAVVIDVGINEVERNGEKILVGDVNFNDVYDKVSMITPVPGGVGPMTIAMLMENTLKSAKRKLLK